MKAWWELYKKELYSISFAMLVIILIIAGWEFFLLSKAESWSMEFVFGLSFIPFAIFPFLMLWQGYHSFSQEWKDDTIYFLLSLPRAGWQLTLAKFLAGMTFYAGISLFTTILIYFSQWRGIRELLAEVPPGYISKGMIVGLIVKGFIAYLLFGLLFYLLSQFSFLISQFFDRFKGLITIIVFILSNYLFYRGGSLLAPLFKWIPDLPIKFIDVNFGILRSSIIYIGTGPLIGSLIILILLFITGSWVLEKHLEI